MPLSNKDILSRINVYGVDAAVNDLDPKAIEDDVIKIIVRTIQQSKEILVNTLEEATVNQFFE